MNVYKIRFNSPKYQSVRIETVDLIQSMGGGPNLPNGEPVAPIWKQPPATWVATRDTATEIPDIGEWEGEMVLSPKAYAALKDALSPWCEFLPVTIDGQVWHLANVLTHINDVDEDNTELEKMDGIVIDIKKLAFNLKDVKSTLIFRSHYTGRADIYCTDKFADLVKQFGFTGIVFQKDLAYCGPIELAPFYSKE